MNVQPVTLDSGPSMIATSNTPAVNTIYTSITLCVPGSTASCQTIDHIQVDTGSYGLRILSSVLTLSLPIMTDSSGNAIAECTQFVDGSSWGPVRKADIQVSGENAPGALVQVIGDSSYPNVPSACPGPAENDVTQFGANGILGIGSFVADCGGYCETTIANGYYYSCPTPTSCNQSTASAAQQVANPVASFASDNNGVILELPALTAPATSVTGSLIFGIGTQANNGLGSAKIYTIDPNTGYFTTQFNGSSLADSFIDSGSNGYFFPDSNITVCTDQPFYCPAAPLNLSATIQGANGTSAVENFTVTNADNTFSTGTVIAAAPDLAGPSSTTSGTSSSFNGSQSFDFGVPFFFGRKVFTAIEGDTVAGTAGPYVAF